MPLLDDIRAKLKHYVPARHYRWLALGVVGVVGFAILYAVVSQSPPKPKAGRTPPKQRQVFMPMNMDKKMGVSGVSSELDKMRKQNAELQKKLEETQDLVKQLKGRLPEAHNFQQEVDRRIQEALQKLPPPAPEAKPKAEEPKKPAGQGEAQGEAQGQDWWRQFQEDGKGRKPAAAPPAAPAPAPAPKEAKAAAPRPAPGKPGEPGKPEAHRPGDIRVVSAKDSQKGDVAAVKDKKQQQEDKGTFIPAGSIFSGTLLTGMDVPTGHQGRRDPFPVLLRVKKEAILPNRYRTDVRECFLIASGWGDLSSERAYVRAERVSCIRDDGKALESNLQMYAVGEDGKAGIRGRVVNKTGALLGRALVAGFLEGFSKLFGKQPMVSIYTPSAVGRNAKAPFESYLSSDAIQSAGLAGAGSAMDRLAKYYIDMAENIYPVIEIDAGRQIDFILLSGVNLKLQQGKVTLGD